MDVYIYIIHLCIYTSTNGCITTWNRTADMSFPLPAWLWPVSVSPDTCDMQQRAVR